MTGQEMLNSILGNIGNRVSGRIGSENVSTVALRALNLAVPHIVQEAQPDYYNRTASLSIVTGTRIYALPTQDEDGETIRIKDLINYRLSRSGGSSVKIEQLNFQEFVDRTFNYDEETEGTPHYFALWGKNNKLHWDYVPSEDFTMTLYVEVYPNLITSDVLATNLPIHDQWNIVVEAFATYYIYLKLQQIQMYTFWKDEYLKQKASVSRTENEKQGHNIHASKGRVPHISDPLLDPFIGSYN